MLIRSYWQAVIFLLAVVNLFSFLLMAYDKHAAKHRHRRISVKKLWLVSLVGAAAGSWFAMYALRHKTRHASFVVGMPLLLVAQAALIFWFSTR